MCGRYTLSQTDGLPGVFEISEVRIPPRFNIAPTQEAPVVRCFENDQRKLDSMRWGLIPSWSKDPSIGARLINARSETVDTKPAFREAFRRRRCLVPADGFYEWRKEAGGKQPYRIGMQDNSVFAFAGLWELFHKGRLEVESFTILTCEPNEVISKLHNRMPVILPREAYIPWLDSGTETSQLISLLRPYSARNMISYPVSRLVNSPRNDGPACIEPENRPPSLFS